MSARRVLPDLETERLLILHREEKDAPIYRQLWTERDARVPAHRRISADGRPSLDDIASQIRAERRVTGPGIRAVQLKGTREVIGYCGLNHRDDDVPDEPELAFELLRAFHGHGYATEAGRALIDWAAEAGYRRLWAGVRTWNLPSRRVLQKLGFTETDQVEADEVHGDSLLLTLNLSGFHWSG